MSKAKKVRPKFWTGIIFNVRLVAIAAAAVVFILLFWGYSYIGAKGDQDLNTANAALTQTNLNDELKNEPQNKQSQQSEHGPDNFSSDAAQSTLGSFGVSCPVRLTSDCSEVKYRQGFTTESWSAYSVLECRAATKELLLGLREDGFELVQYGFLDLSNDAWGCVVKSQDDTSYVISLIPEKIGMPSSPTNKLVITVVHIQAPEIEPVGGN